MLLEEEFPPDIRVENEINTLLKNGHEIKLVCTTRKGLPKIEEKGKLSIYRLPLSKLLFKLRAFAIDLPIYYNFWYKNLNKIINWDQVDAIHVHDLPLAKVGCKLSLRHRLKYVLDLHENRPDIMKYYNYTNTFPGNILISLKKWERYQKKITPKADRLILITDVAKKDYVSRYKLQEEKVFSVPNFPNTDVLEDYKTDQEIIEKYKDKSMFLYFGDTGVRRGTLDIIESANLLKDKPNIQFVIIGSSREQSQLEKRIRDLGLTNVELTGYIAFEKITSYIKASKAGLCPFHKNLHHDTTYANKLFQLMYFGRPLISSDCIAQQLIIEKEKCGFIFPSGDAKILSHKIIKLTQLNKEEYDLMGENGRKAVLSKYHLEKGHKNLINIYNTL